MFSRQVPCTKSTSPGFRRASAGPTAPPVLQSTVAVSAATREPVVSPKPRRRMTIPTCLATRSARRGERENVTPPRDIGTSFSASVRLRCAATAVLHHTTARLATPEIVDPEATAAIRAARYPGSFPELLRDGERR